MYRTLPLLLLTHSLNANTTYPPFAVPPEDVAWVLNQTQTTQITPNTSLPADISYIVGDIKYDDAGRLAFCECGNGIYMSLRDTDLAFNDHQQRSVAPFWGIFWNYLAQFNLPIWLVEDTGPANALATEELSKRGGIYAKNLEQLEKSKSFKACCNPGFTPSNDIKQYSGIIVYRANNEVDRDGKRITQFQQTHPDFLFVSTIAQRYVKRKDDTYQLFIAAGLETLLPRFKMCPSRYTDFLASTIITELNATKFVIKPPYASFANGVNAIDAAGLDNFLRLILQDNKQITSKHRGLAYWRYNTPPSVMIAEHVPSKTIYKDNNSYDPTMRVVFMLCHNKNTISFTPVAGFWKIPIKPLNDTNASLTEKHITIAHAGDQYTGILADKKDWQDIVTILNKTMPQLYLTMLEQNKITSKS